MEQYCPDDRLAEAVELVGSDDSAGLARVAALLGDHPDDPRLHFLYGSLLAGNGRFEEARMAMGRSVEIAPDYAIARFQLGLLELSSGDAAAACATLDPLAEDEAEAALPLFARGLQSLARDDLGVARALLRRGIAVNREHPLVSRDMELIIARIDETGAAGGEAEQDVSAADFLLRQAAAKSTRH
jgi:tetratricopeptide (TPR) repeat protein